ncbi:MAG: Iron-sulfur cluster carrier protein [Candidatus Dichloromethanomonas elyunquensis]|nr:MAG: Iron-sulfur cluster carrier protein [Candidatus Dichloromethanomonas elyunquensis]
MAGENHAVNKQGKRIIVLWSVCSVGKSTLACNLARKLAKETNLKIGLLDFSLITPCLHLFLELEDKESSIEYILKSWQENYSYRDLLKENAHIMKNLPNLLCWTGLTKEPELIDKLGDIQARTIITELSDLVDILFIDVQSDTLIIPTDAALKTATDVLVIVDQNRNTIENTAKWLNNLHERNMDISKFKLIINQYSNKALYTKNKIESNLALPLLGTIPGVSKVNYDNSTVSLVPLLKYGKFDKAIENILLQLHLYKDIKKHRIFFTAPRLGSSR